MKTYESDERINNSYGNEISSHSDIGVAKGRGPVLHNGTYKD